MKPSSCGMCFLWTGKDEKTNDSPKDILRGKLNCRMTGAAEMDLKRNEEEIGPSCAELFPREFA